MHSWATYQVYEILTSSRSILIITDPRRCSSSPRGFPPGSHKCHVPRFGICTTALSHSPRSFRILLVSLSM